MKKYKIPIKYYNIPGGGTHLFVKSKINGIKTFLLIDTGASNSVFDINNPQFKDTKFEIKDDDIQSSGFNSTISNLHTGTINSLRICHLTILNKETIFTPLDYINSLYETIKLPKISGIIGSDFLIEYSAIINLKTNILYLEKK